jgi:ubiquinone/menaquinone biosynthesis C-methylase UbiE
VTEPNTDQRTAWNGASGVRWAASADRRDAVLAPVADALLDLSAITTGQHVLDVGCGCGATSLAAARATGPTGRVVGVDLSAPMLALAATRAAQSAMVEFVEADAQTFERTERFDLAISRFGTMFFDDPAGAFANIARHLVPGGRICIATWQPLVANEWLTVPGAALLRCTAIPEGAGVEGPGMFAQSDPAVVRRLLLDAGFVDVDALPQTVGLRLGATVDDAVEHLTESGPGRTVLEAIPEDDRSEALAAVAEALRPHHHADRGVVLGAGILLTTGRTER